MNDYLCGLIAISALVGISSYLSYGERQDKALRAASLLILVCVAVSVPVAFIKENPNFDFSDISISDLVIEDTQLGKDAREAFCDGVAEFVSSEFSIPKEEIEVVAFDFDLGAMRAERIKVILSGRAVLADNRAVAAAVKDAGLGECEVELNVK